MQKRFFLHFVLQKEERDLYLRYQDTGPAILDVIVVPPQVAVVSDGSVVWRHSLANLNE
jgi:hypothetical protein